MRRSFLQQECIQLYKQMLRQTAGCERTPSDERKWMEGGMMEKIQLWFPVERMSDGYQFAGDEEENSFFEVLRSRFADWVNFLYYYIDPLVAAG